MKENVEIIVVFNIYHYETGGREISTSFPAKKINKAFQLKRIIDLSRNASVRQDYGTFTYRFGIKFLEDKNLTGFIASEANIYSVVTNKLT